MLMEKNREMNREIDSLHVLFDRLIDGDGLVNITTKILPIDSIWKCDSDSDNAFEIPKFTSSRTSVGERGGVVAFKTSLLRLLDSSDA